VAVIGLIIPAGLVVLLVLKDWKANDIATIVGLFTGLVGTLVGAFLGVQVGSAGKQAAQKLAIRALAALPPDRAEQVLKS
jgi:hypothetical protein